MRTLGWDRLFGFGLLAVFASACGDTAAGALTAKPDAAQPAADAARPDAAPPEDAAPPADAAPAPDASPGPDAAPPPDAAPAEDAGPEKDAAIEDAELPPDVPPPPPDNDGDGFNALDDCDDENANVYPGAAEVENGIDDDCDGYRDEIAVCADGVAPYQTIQSAVDLAPLGAVVEVCPGVWTENVRMTRAITLRGGGMTPYDVVIDGANAGSTVTIAGTEVDEIALNNLQIRGGNAIEGGGVRCESGLLMVTGAHITANTATHGAGVFVRGCQVLISANEIDGNVAAELGGGVHLDRARGEVGDNRIANNQARRGGGVAIVEGEAVVRGNDIRGNNAVDGQQPGTALGGGIWANSNALIDGNRVVDNTTDFDGGGLYVMPNRSGTIANNTFEDNHAGGDGGGVYLSRSARGVFEFNVVRGNRAEDDGGGLRVFTSQAIVQFSEFIRNEAGDDGGGVKISHNLSNLRDCLVEENSAGDKGGGVELDNDHSLVERLVIRNNFATYGGGLHASTAHQAHRVYDTRIEGNIAAQCGGGMYFNDETYALESFRIEVINNSAARGGGLCAFNMANYAFTNALFVGNRADLTGGAIHSENSNARFNFVTFSDNAAEDGAALYALTGQFNGASNIVYRSLFGPAITSSGANVAWGYSNVFLSDNAPFMGMGDPTGASGNLADEPNFADPDQRDFHLIAPSVCIDTGSPGLSDRDGSPADMGYYGGPESP